MFVYMYIYTHTCWVHISALPHTEFVNELQEARFSLLKMKDMTIPTSQGVQGYMRSCF